MPYVSFFEEDADDEDDDGDGDDPPQRPFEYLRPWNGQARPVHVPVHTAGNGAGSESLSQLYRHWKQSPEPPANLLLPTVAERLAALGAVRAYSRYDGGSDEDFAYFGHCELKDGTLWNAERVTRELCARDAALAGLHAADLTRDVGELLDLIAHEWAMLLLGKGYGTGNFSMYGGFWVELDSGLLTDDPGAAAMET